MWGAAVAAWEKEKNMSESQCFMLGHFYESLRCIYCDADYCQEEKGGHSFETEVYQYGASPRYCAHCERQLVNIRKRQRR